MARSERYSVLERYGGTGSELEGNATEGNGTEGNGTEARSGIRTVCGCGKGVVVWKANEKEGKGKETKKREELECVGMVKGRKKIWNRTVLCTYGCGFSRRQ